MTAAKAAPLVERRRGEEGVTSIYVSAAWAFSMCSFPYMPARLARARPRSLGGNSSQDNLRVSAARGNRRSPACCLRAPAPASQGGRGGESSPCIFCDFHRRDSSSGSSNTVRCYHVYSETQLETGSAVIRLVTALQICLFPPPPLPPPFTSTTLAPSTDTSS